MKRIIFILLFCPLTIFAQELADTTYGKLYPNNYTVGINFNTSGWGFYGEYAKKKTYKYYRAYGLSITNIHHKNEFKIRGVTGTRSYYYKKINSLVVIRPSYGGNIKMFNAEREDGIEMTFKWKIGPAFGFVKPVYLDILKQQGIGASSIAEKYDPEKHENINIEGKANWTKGIGEGNFQIGASGKAGVNFNFAKEKSSISGGEIGLMLDYFPVKEIELMYGTENFRFFGAFYLQFELGNRF